MRDRLKALRAGSLALALAFFSAPAALAESANWQVSKSSGDVWVTTSEVQQASLTDESILKPGDNIRTGKNGRVLLVRGQESILISPNSVVGVPRDTKGDLPTTIMQQAGSILLEVEERNVKHFQVETPYLAAVVKGTQFRVTVGAFGSRVDVLRGKVEVSDHKSGQFALVLPGQDARVSAQGDRGLSLSGSGTLNPVQQGTPRPSSLTRVAVPMSGLSAPKTASNERVRAVGQLARAAATAESGPRDAAVGAGNSLRITSMIGDVKLNFQNITKGLVRAEGASNSRAAKGSDKTVWSSDGLTPGNGVGKTYSQGNGGGNGNAVGHAGGTQGSNAGGNGNGNAFGLANATAAGANGNNGNGNGNGKGKGKGKS